MGRNICIILLFDPITNQHLTRLMEKTAAFDLPTKNHYPHLTIANYPGINPRKVKSYFANFFKKIKAFPISFIHLIRLDQKIIAIEPGSSNTLMEIYENFNIKYGEDANVWTKSIATFRPHISIAQGEAAILDQLYPYLLDAFVPFNGYITAVEVSEVLNEGYKILARIDLEK
ncbi:MAG: 2'-5' RNA ligase family protein [Bacilli bacterium]